MMTSLMLKKHFVLLYDRFPQHIHEEKGRKAAKVFPEQDENILLDNEIYVWVYV